MAESFSVEAILKANVRDFVRGFKEAENQAKNFVQRNEATFDSFKKVGKVATVAGVAVAGGLLFAVKKAADFEAGMSKVAAISGATGKELDDLTTTARDWGSATSFSANDAAAGMEKLALAGWDTKQIMGGIGPVLHLAEAGNIALDRSAELVTNSMAGMKIGVGDLIPYLDKVATTAANADTDIDQLMEAFVVAGGTFERLNIPLEESSAMLGIMADNGFKGAEAGTAMNAIVSRLTKTTGPAAEALEEMGVKAFDGEGKFKGLETVMMEVSEELSTMTDEERENNLGKIAGLNHSKAFNAMLDVTGDKYGELKGKIENSSGALKEMRDIMKDNLQGELENLSSAFEEIAISIGTALLPMVKKMTEFVQSLADKFNGLDDKTKTIIAVVATLAAGFLLLVGPILMLIGFIPSMLAGFAALSTVFAAVGTALAAIGWPITLVVAALISAAALIYVYWEPIKEFFIMLWEGIKIAGLAIWDALKGAWSATVEFLTNLWSTVAEFFSNLWLSISTVAISMWDSVVEKWNEIVSVFMDIFSPMIEFYSNLWTTITSTAVEIFQTFTETLATVWSSIQTIAAAAWEIIKNVILAPILLLINLATGDFKGFASNLLQIQENIRAAASRIWEALKTGVVAIITGLISVGLRLWNNFKSTLANLMSAIRQTISNLWESLKSSVIRTIASLVTSAIGKWNELKSKAISIVGNIVKDLVQKWEDLKTKTLQKIKGVKDNVINPLKEINLLQIGKDVIQGLINGIKSKVKAVGNAVKDVTSAITGKLKSILQIKSPSRVFMGFGDNIVGGLAIGMDKARRVAERAADMLGVGVTDAFNPDLAMPDIAGQVNSINRQANRQMQSHLTSEFNVNSSKQDIVINLDSNEIARATVGDITKIQNEATYGRRKSSRRN